jgi:hypothetical protein
MRLTLTRAAMWFGIIMLAVGILGFIPGITNDGYLFHFIKVGTGPNIVHLLLGVIALGAAASEAASRLFFQAVAVAYAVTLVIGLFMPDGQVWGFMDSNWWTELARLAVAGYAAVLGWDLMGERAALTTGATTAPTFGERMDRDDR